MQNYSVSNELMTTLLIGTLITAAILIAVSVYFSRTGKYTTLHKSTVSSASKKKGGTRKGADRSGRRKK